MAIERTTSKTSQSKPRKYTVAWDPCRQGKYVLVFSETKSQQVFESWGEALVAALVAEEKGEI